MPAQAMSNSGISNTIRTPSLLGTNAQASQTYLITSNPAKMYPWLTSGFGTGSSSLSGTTTIFGSPSAFSSTAKVYFTKPDAYKIEAYGIGVGGFGKLISSLTPAVMPGYIAVTDAGTALAAGHGTTPFVSAYPWSAGFGTKYADPATLPGVYANDLAFNPAGTVLAIALNGVPYTYAVAFSSATGFGTKYANPATSPTGVAGVVCWNPAGTAIGFGHNGTPFMTFYPWSAGFGTKYANPATLPGGLVDSSTFNAAGTAVAVSYAFSPYVSVYAWSAGFGTKYANPATLPTAASTGTDAISFDSTGTALALTNYGQIPSVYAFNTATGWGSKYTASADVTAYPTADSGYTQFYSV
jgi:hypothetical protein